LNHKCNLHYLGSDRCTKSAIIWTTDAPGTRYLLHTFCMISNADWIRRISVHKCIYRQNTFSLLLIWVWFPTCKTMQKNIVQVIQTLSTETRNLSAQSVISKILKHWSHCKFINHFTICCKLKHGLYYKTTFLWKHHTRITTALIRTLFLWGTYGQFYYKPFVLLVVPTE